MKQQSTIALSSLCSLYLAFGLFHIILPANGNDAQIQVSARFRPAAIVYISEESGEKYLKVASREENGYPPVSYLTSCYRSAEGRLQGCKSRWINDGALHPLEAEYPTAQKSRPVALLMTLTYF